MKEVERSSELRNRSLQESRNGIKVGRIIDPPIGHYRKGSHRLDTILPEKSVEEHRNGILNLLGERPRPCIDGRPAPTTGPSLEEAWVDSFIFLGSRNRRS